MRHAMFVEALVQFPTAVAESSSGPRVLYLILSTAAALGKLDANVTWLRLHHLLRHFTYVFATPGKSSGSSSTRRPAKH